MRVKCSVLSIPKRSGDFVRAWFKLLEIELEAVRIPSSDRRPIFAVYCSTASAEVHEQLRSCAEAIRSLKQGSAGRISPDLQLLGVNVYFRCRHRHSLLTWRIGNWLNQPLPPEMTISV
jgi:hypothetical protein